MTDETQLRLQLQQEIDREARIDKMIENSIERFLKKYRQFKRVDRREDSDAVLIFYKNNIGKYNMALTGNEEEAFILNDPELADKIVTCYVKNKNKHDSRLHTYSYIKKRA